MGSKSIQNSLEDFICDLVQNHNCGEDAIKSITISPFLFEKLERETLQHISRHWTNGYEPATKCTMSTQMGVVTIIKDLDPIIEKKKKQVDFLLEEIKKLEKSQ